VEDPEAVAGVDEVVVVERLRCFDQLAVEAQRLARLEAPPIGARMHLEQAPDEGDVVGQVDQGVLLRGSDDAAEAGGHL